MPDDRLAEIEARWEVMRLHAILKMQSRIANCTPDELSEINHHLDIQEQLRRKPKPPEAST